LAHRQQVPMGPRRDWQDILSKPSSGTKNPTKKTVGGKKAVGSKVTGSKPAAKARVAKAATTKVAATKSAAGQSGRKAPASKVSKKQQADKPVSATLQFDEHKLLPMLFGDFDRNLAQIEQKLGVVLLSRGNRVSVSGDSVAVEEACQVMNDLYQRLQQGLPVGSGEVDGAIRMASDRAPRATAGGASQNGNADSDSGGLPQIQTRLRVITPRTPRQTEYFNAMANNELVFCEGPAGSGKTYLAVAMAVSMFLEGRVDRIVLSRPAVEAGERLGFLPGDLREKVDPYLRPLYDALHDMLPGDQITKRLEMDDFEVAPLAFMRGRTLRNSFVILDEAQNTTEGQMKMFLTRLGESSRMVVTGDPSQIDLPPGQKSGLVDAVGLLRRVKGVGHVKFTEEDVVRHPLVARMVKAYDSRENGSDTKGTD